MKFRTILFLCLVSFYFSSPLVAAQVGIRIVYPQEDQSIPAVDSTFIYGSVAPGSRLWINETPVPVFSNGAFLAYLPVSSGDFIFNCLAVHQGDTIVVERSVSIASRRRVFPVDSLGFDPAYVVPRTNSLLRPGDVLEVSVKGTPGCNAFFDIQGLVWEMPMTERMPLTRHPWGEAVFGDMKFDTTGVRGIYTGAYHIQPWDVAENASITFYLKDGQDTVSVDARGVLTVESALTPRISVLTDETVIARPSPGHAYAWFLPKGVKMQHTGQKGDWHRIHLSQNHEAWVPEGSFRELPLGTALPRQVVRFVRTENLEDRVRVSIPLRERIPFHVRQDTHPSSLVVTLYGATSDTDWIPQDFDDPLIRDIRWRQAESDVYELDILLHQEQQWGYTAAYNGTTLELEIKKKPRIHRSVFKDITICLDPGHQPGTGAVGPSGLEEREVNLAVARELQKMLERRGAIVVMTREGEEGIDLYTRPKVAVSVDADLLVSIHFNGLPDGVNPWKNNGSSTYYFHPMGRRLARLIHEEVLKELRLPDFGVYYANLALCRPSQMPAVLTEEAFMLIPQQEMLLRQPAFRKRCARAIFKGLEKFLKENR